MTLIEREAAIKTLQEHGVATGFGTHLLKNLPTIDPIRAAGGCRCGECRYWDGDGKCEPPENGLIQEYTKPTDFCSYGEPREAQDDG